MNKITIGVLGSGTWGMALARLLANSDKEVTVWSAISSEIDNLKATNKYPKLPQMVLPTTISYTTDIKEACENKDIVLFSVPSVFVRETAKKAAPYIGSGQLVVDVAKGLENDSFKTLSQVLEDELGSVRVVALSGPTHAEEVAIDLPTMIVAASQDNEAANFVQSVFSTPYMKVFTCPDIRGVEICGAIKNIFALAAGLSDGLGYGDNAKAAIMTMGIHEMKRLGLELGCQEETFFGLAGLGDLIVTCMSPHSRNNRCGRLLGQGLPVEEATAQIGMVVEGLNALPPVVKLAKTRKIDMPMVKLLDMIVRGVITPQKAVSMIYAIEKANQEMC